MKNFFDDEFASEEAKGTNPLSSYLSDLVDIKESLSSDPVIGRAFASTLKQKAGVDVETPKEAPSLFERFFKREKEPDAYGGITPYAVFPERKSNVAPVFPDPVWEMESALRAEAARRIENPTTFGDFVNRAFDRNVVAAAEGVRDVLFGVNQPEREKEPPKAMSFAALHDADAERRAEEMKAKAEAEQKLQAAFDAGERQRREKSGMGLYIPASTETASSGTLPDEEAVRRVLANAVAEVVEKDVPGDAPVTVGRDSLARRINDPQWQYEVATETGGRSSLLQQMDDPQWQYEMERNIARIRAAKDTEEEKKIKHPVVNDDWIVRDVYGKKLSEVLGRDKELRLAEEREISEGKYPVVNDDWIVRDVYGKKLSDVLVKDRALREEEAKEIAKPGVIGAILGGGNFHDIAEKMPDGWVKTIVSGMSARQELYRLGEIWDKKTNRGLVLTPAEQMEYDNLMGSDLGKKMEEEHKRLGKDFNPVNYVKKTMMGPERPQSTWDKMLFGLGESIFSSMLSPMSKAARDALPVTMAVAVGQAMLGKPTNIASLQHAAKINMIVPAAVGMMRWFHSLNDYRKAGGAMSEAEIRNMKNSRGEYLKDTLRPDEIALFANWNSMWGVLAEGVGESVFLGVANKVIPKSIRSAVGGWVLPGGGKANTGFGGMLASARNLAAAYAMEIGTENIEQVGTQGTRDISTWLHNERKNDPESMAAYMSFDDRMKELWDTTTETATSFFLQFAIPGTFAIKSGYNDGLTAQQFNEKVDQGINLLPAAVQMVINDGGYIDAKTVERVNALTAQAKEAAEKGDYAKAGELLGQAGRTFVSERVESVRKGADEVAAMAKGNVDVDGKAFAESLLNKAREELALFGEKEESVNAAESDINSAYNASVMLPGMQRRVDALGRLVTLDGLKDDSVLVLAEKTVREALGKANEAIKKNNVQVMNQHLFIADKMLETGHERLKELGLLPDTPASAVEDAKAEEAKARSGRGGCYDREYIYEASP